jgi:hypothetical protein
VLNPAPFYESAQSVADDVSPRYRYCRSDTPLFGQIVLKINDVEFVIVIQEAADFSGPLDPMFFFASGLALLVLRHRFRGFFCRFDSGQSNVDEVQLLLMKPFLLFKQFKDLRRVDIHFYHLIALRFL